MVSNGTENRGGGGDAIYYVAQLQKKRTPIECLYDTQTNIPHVSL